MDNYINEDREAVKNVFSSIADKFEKASEDTATKDDILTMLGSCYKDIEILRFKLQHISEVEGTPDADQNKMGISVVKNQLKSSAQEIRDSIEDLSWVESVDEFKDTQRSTAKQIEDVLNNPEASEDQKAQAKQIYNIISGMIPSDDTPEWVIRKQKTESILTGITSAVSCSLIDAAKL
jgi:hypothetical protein